MLPLTTGFLEAIILTTLALRLWHQLTQKLFDFFDHPLSQPYRVDVFDKFVRDFESRLNQLRLVEMGVKVSKDLDSTHSHYFMNHGALKTFTYLDPKTPKYILPS